jgi:hypothetical protein
MIKTFIASLFVSASASAGIVTFDNLPVTLGSIGDGERLTVPVDGFSFKTSGTVYDSPSAWFYYNPYPSMNQSVPPSKDIGIRGTTAIYSGWYNTSYSPNPIYRVSRTDGGLWQFNKAFFTALWGAGTIHLIGMRDGVEVFNFTQSIINTQQTMVSMSSYPGPVAWIDTLKISNDLAVANGNRHFIMDDMYYTLPSPGALALMACGLFGIRNRRRLTRTV